MKREGVAGFITPAPIIIPFEAEEIRPVRAFAKREARKTGWPVHNCFLGAMGEAALAKYIYEQLRIRYMMKTMIYAGPSDGGVDIRVADVKIQVKTHAEDRDCLVKATTGMTGRGRRTIPLRSNVFVFVEPVRDNIYGVGVKMAIQGWIKRHKLEERGQLRESYVGSHLNFHIGTEHLEPLSSLMALLRARMELRRM
jgi:hypothetical protein